jgi:hypothetical protein
VGRVKMGVTMMISQLGSGGRLVLGYGGSCRAKRISTKGRKHMARGKRCMSSIGLFNTATYLVTLFCIFLSYKNFSSEKIPSKNNLLPPSYNKCTSRVQNLSQKYVHI